MKNPPNIESARVIEPGVMELVWSTGETLNVNLSDLPKRNAAFAKLADPTFFARMKRDEWGHGIGWPGAVPRSASPTRADAPPVHAVHGATTLAVWHCTAWGQDHSFAPSSLKPAAQACTRATSTSNSCAGSAGLSRCPWYL